MKNFKIGDKIIINKKKDIDNLFSSFYNQELEIIDITFNSFDNKNSLIWFKSKINNLTDKGHSNFFKLSPQIGDRVKILSKGTENNVNLNYTGEYGTILDVSYLDKFPYLVKLDKTNAFGERYEAFVEEVEIIESKSGKTPWVKEDFKNIRLQVNPEQSEKLQKYLFTLDIPWWQIGYEITNLDCRNLFISDDYYIVVSNMFKYPFSEKTILFEDIVFPDNNLDTSISEKLSLSDEAKYRIFNSDNCLFHSTLSQSQINETINKEQVTNTELDNKAYKDKNNKLYYDLDWQFIQDLASLLFSNKVENGGKYNRGNWKKDLEIADLEDALDRHYFKYKLGLSDEEHDLAIVANIMMLRYLKRNK